jgi:hypothetical protein
LFPGIGQVIMGDAHWSSYARRGRLTRVALAAAAAAALVLACSDEFVGPVFGEGCSTEQQSVVRLEGGLRITQVYVTREYTRLDGHGAGFPSTRHYRACQAFTCTAVREDDPPLTEEEVAAALAACREEADSAWAVEYPN